MSDHRIELADHAMCACGHRADEHAFDGWDDDCIGDSDCIIDGCGCEAFDLVGPPHLGIVR